MLCVCARVAFVNEIFILFSRSYYIPATPSASSTTATKNGEVDDQNEVGNHHQQQHHQIVLLANEQLEPSDNEQSHIAGAGDDDANNGDRKILNGATGDEELTPLTWLHDKNLLKGKFVVEIKKLKLMLPLFTFRNQLVMSQSAIV